MSLGLSSPLILDQYVVRWVGLVLRFLTIEMAYLTYNFFILYLKCPKLFECGENIITTPAPFVPTTTSSTPKPPNPDYRGAGVVAAIVTGLIILIMFISATVFMMSRRSETNCLR